jgi:hypothetical protein
MINPNFRRDLPSTGGHSFIAQMDEPPVIENVEPAPKASRRWLYIALGILLVLCIGVLVTLRRDVKSARAVPASSAATITSTVPAQVIPAPPPAPVSQPPAPARTPGDFAGRWNGWWDKAWEVHFTITREVENDQWSVLYEWEERSNEPLRQMKFQANRVGDVLMLGNLIEITLTDTNRAVAVGKFKKPRTARLTRE